jgi:hypothetical protein
MLSCFEIYSMDVALHRRAAIATAYAPRYSEIVAEILLKISRQFGKSIEWLLTGEDALLRK